MIDQRPGILDFVDREIVEALACHLRQMGTTFRLREKVTRVGINPQLDRVFAELESGKKVQANGLLYAVGRQANGDQLRPEAAGLEPDPRGRLRVNQFFQTDVLHIYAAGDVIEASGASVVTAEDIRQNAGGRKLEYWVINDACPPSPGCAFPRKVPPAASSGVSFAEVWQFAQSPRRPDFASGCPANYDKDGNCYPPGVDPAQRLHVDVNIASSSDPSRGRTRD